MVVFLVGFPYRDVQERPPVGGQEVNRVGHHLLVRGSIPAKVVFWVGLRIFSYVPTPTKLTNAISKTKLSGPKKGVFLPKTPRMWHFFCIWRILAVFSGLKPPE